MAAFLDQLEHTLSSFEQHVHKLFTSQSHLVPVDTDVQRSERPCQLAGTIDRLGYCWYSTVLAPPLAYYFRLSRERLLTN
jgi:hypothetical protein